MKPTRGVILLVFSLLLAVTSAIAGSDSVFPFLRSDMNARAAGLAGSFVSIQDDPASLFYNPAALGTLTQARGSATFFKNLLDVNAGALTYGQEIQDVGFFGAGIIYQNYGSFTETDELGNSVGTFSAADLCLAIGYSGTLDQNLYWGANIKYIYSSIAGSSSSALAGDVGILYTIPESRFAVGASLRNIGRQLSTYLGTRENLPLDATIGISVIPKGLPLLLNLNLHNLNQDVDSFGERFRSFTIGGEFTLSRVLVLRVGYDNERRKDLNLGSASGLVGFSAGLGITVDRYRVDYALSSLGKIGMLHQIGISATF